MSTKFQTLCREPRSIRLSSFEDMSDYVTEFNRKLWLKVTVSFFLGHPVQYYYAAVLFLRFWGKFDDTYTVYSRLLSDILDTI